MTQPGSFPALNRIEPPANPAPGGLYSAATLDDLADPARLGGGVLLESRQRGAHGHWPSMCETVPEDQVKGGDSECQSLTPFPSTVVWAANDAKLPGLTEQDATLSAQQTLRVVEQVDVEAWLAPLLMERAGTPATAGDAEGSALVAALAAVEAAGSESGLPLVIHAPRSAAALAAYRGLVVKGSGRTGRLETPLGNVWAFGSGYEEELEGTLVATGPVTVLRSTVETSAALELEHNLRHIIVEREVAVTWETPTVAARYK